MTERERLIKLLNQAEIEEMSDRVQVVENALNEDLAEKIISRQEKIASYLLANGVIVLLCKAGDTVYHLQHVYKGNRHVDTRIISLVVDGFVIGDNNSPQMNTCDNERNVWHYYEMADIGRNVFLSYEEAESALKNM